MQLQIGKQYRTRDGSGVAKINAIVSCRRRVGYPARGEWVTVPTSLPGKQFICAAWTLDGDYDTTSPVTCPLDLIEEVP
jgi:hypothetical protein